MQSTSESEQHACAPLQRSVTTFKPRLIRGAVVCILLFGSLLSGCYNDPETRLAEIRAIQAGGRFDESIKPLRVLLTAEPDQPEANYRLGIALVQTGRSSLALWPLMKAANSEEFGTQSGLLLTATLISQESYEEAIRAINRVLEKDPDNINALYARASALIGAARAGEALEDAEHVLRLKPGDGHGYSIKMASLLDLDRFDEAEASQIELVKITEAGTSVDQAARACGVLARFYADQGDNSKSQETHETCLEKYPDHPMVREWAASFYTITGQLDQAISIWRGAVDRNPEDFELRATLADQLIEARRLDEAEKVMAASAELFDSARAYQKLSKIYRKNNKPAEARVALETALSRTRNEPDVLRYTVGDLFIEEGDLDSAEQVADSLKEPSYRHLLKAAILLARDEPAAALRKFDEGLRLWPNNARARYLAGVAAQRSGDHDRATTEFRESVRVSETETDASLQLARIYYTLGQYATARQFAARHAKNRPLTSPEAHIISSRSAAALGDLKAAFGGLDTLQKTVFAAAAVAERASLVREHGSLPEAIEVIENSKLDLADLANTAALRSYAELLYEAGREGDAIAAASALYARNPESTEAMEVKGRVLALAGKTAEANALIDAAIEKDPNFAAALQIKANLTANAGDLDAALGYFDRAAAADYDNPNYAYQAAKLVLAQGETDDAVARLRKIVQGEPGHVGASNDLAWHLAQTDSELEFALKLATRATTRQPDADTLDTLGWVQYKLGSIDDAIESFNKALELRPDSASIR
ncbi:MAG: tetratricopeptide repeat protein, partial [Deltaproteobacteria bacterium]|nr:tetratricopeptide repeat protein [Deltaproteobacteria bacterium]